MIKTLLAKSIGAYFNSVSFFSRYTAIRQAFNLFSTPRKGRYTPEDRSFIDTAKTQYVDTKGVSFAYHHWEGTGPSVLFCHGWESNTARWQSYIEQLQHSNINVYSIDAPAHGMTSGTTISAVLYAEGIHAVVTNVQPDIIIGHSLGGMAVGYYVHHYSTAIRHIVLLSTPSGLVDMTGRYFDIIGMRRALIPDMMNYFKEHFDIDPEDFSTARHMENCPIPGLIIHDDQDDVTPFDESLEISQAWPLAAHQTTHNLGHSLKDKQFINKLCAYIISTIQGFE